MKRIQPALPFILSGVVFLVVGIVVAVLWRRFMPLVVGASYLAIGLVVLVRQRGTRE